MANSALMSIGMRAMAANYAALNATGHNIANANVEGYSRQNVVLSTATGQFTGAGFFGKGVDVTTVERQHSDFLTRQAQSTAAMSAADEARSRQLQQIEKAFGLGEAGLGDAANQLFNAFVDVAAKPQDLSSRQVVLARAGELADRFNTAAGTLDSVAAGITAELKTDIKRANELTGKIAQINEKIAGLKGSGQPPNDLLDQRDQAIQELGGLIQVSTVAADDGTMSVFIGGGQRLVLGSTAATLVAMPDDYDPQTVQLGIQEGSSPKRRLPDNVLTGGAIAGLLRVQNSDIPAARNQLGQLASAIAGRVNDQQALGYELGLDASGNPRFGSAMFDTGDLRVAGSSTNATPGSALGITLGVTSSTDLQPLDYELSRDSTGQYWLQRLGTDEDPFQVTPDGSGNVDVDGMRITIGAPAPANGDRFLLQPVASAGRNLARALDDPRGIAAASPVQATLGTANGGTATVASLAATSTSINPNLTATLTFTNGTGRYNVTLHDTTGATPDTTLTNQQWTAGQPIAINGFELMLNGVPNNNDTVVVAKTTTPAADNGNANALLSLRDTAIVGRTTTSTGAVLPAATVTDAYADLLADVGIRVQGAKLSADQSAVLAANAKAARDEKSGVNLDEEAARLLQFQQSYQAAAKMLQVAQQVFDTLLQAAAR